MSVAITGCSDVNEIPLVPVHGRITFDGGPCPKEGFINFAPIETADGLPRRPGTARFDRDGRFVAGAFSNKKGLIPGRYTIRIDCWKRPPLGDGQPPISFIANSYRPPEVEVSVAKGPVELDLDVPLAK